MRALGIAVALAAALGLAAPASAGMEARASGHGSVLLVSQVNAAYPRASANRGGQVLMLLRHFAPDATLVDDDAYRSGMADDFAHVIILGNDAIRPVDAQVLADLRGRRGSTMWVGYGLGALSPDPDRDLGFAPGFVDAPAGAVTISYRGRSYSTALEGYHRVRIARPEVQVIATVNDRGEAVPFVVRGGDFWFFGGLPGFDTDYPRPTVDEPNLIFADVLHDFFGRLEHEPRQAVIRLEDVSAQVPPDRIIDATDLLRARGVPFVIGVVPAQRLADGTVVSLRDRPDVVQALRYAQDRGGTIALHGYHHTFGQGEDYEFWDPDLDAPPTSERPATTLLKLEDGIRLLRDEGLEPRLWETPHYAASARTYAVFGRFFSHAIEDRDPATWLPYPAGPDPAGQTLIPENIGYINEAEGRTVDAQLARAALLRIVRDATAVGFYHPATIPTGDLGRLVDGLAAQGYRFADVRDLPLRVRSSYRPDPVTSVATFLRIEPGLTVLELQRAAPGMVPMGAIGGSGTVVAVAAVLVFIFLVRLRAQWRPRDAPRSRVEPEAGRSSRPLVPLLATLGVAAVLVGATMRLTLLSPVASTSPEPVRESPAVPSGPVEIATDGWSISAYFTAVESFYSGPRVALRGCPVLDCVDGTTLLGRFRRDFITAVKAEGSGRLASPIGRSAYLNWSIDVGYWLDTAPRDARGSILQSYVSAAADPGIAYVTTFRIDRCGVDVRTGESVEPRTCAAIRSASWIVRDRFTAGAVGKRLDLYVGEQDVADFLGDSPRAVDTRDAAITLQPYGTEGWGT